MKLKKPSAALVVALLALFVSLGGVGAAATGLINGNDIKVHTVPASKLTPTAVKFLRGQRGPAGTNGTDGAPGPSGPAGVAGPQGVAGGFDPTKVQYADASGTVPADSLGTATAACPTGTVVIGGGAFTDAASLWVSRPSGNNGWFAGATGYSTISGQIDAYAICSGP